MIILGYFSRCQICFLNSEGLPCGSSSSRRVWIFWKPGNPDVWDLGIQKFGVQKMKKIKVLKIQIRSAQNVGKVWISRKKSSWPYLGPSEAIFSMDRKNPKKCQKNCLFSLVGQWALFTRFGPLLLSTRGGEIGTLQHHEGAFSILQSSQVLEATVRQLVFCVCLETQGPFQTTYSPTPGG